MKDYYLGHISSSNPLELKKISVGEPCTRCDVFSFCGGRCLYTNITKRWDLKAYDLVCGTVRNLIGAIIKEVARIRRLIEDGKVSLEDFEFMKFNGCEIIPSVRVSAWLWNLSIKP